MSIFRGFEVLSGADEEISQNLIRQNLHPKKAYII